MNRLFEIAAVLYIATVLFACAPDPVGPYGNDLAYVTKYGTAVYVEDGVPIPPQEHIEGMQDLYRENVFFDRVETSDIFDGLRMVFTDTAWDVSDICGLEAVAGCYWPGSATMVAPTTNLCSPVLGHEWTHHALNRVTGYSDHDHVFHNMFVDVDGPVKNINTAWDCFDGPKAGALQIDQPLPSFECGIIHKEP